MAAVGRHHRRSVAALRPRHLFCGFLCSGYEYRVDVADLNVDLVDVNLDIDMVDVDLDVDLVDVDLVDILFVVLLMSFRSRYHHTKS